MDVRKGLRTLTTASIRVPAHVSQQHNTGTTARVRLSPAQRVVETVCSGRKESGRRPRTEASNAWAICVTQSIGVSAAHHE